MAASLHLSGLGGRTEVRQARYQWTTGTRSKFCVCIGTCTTSAVSPLRESGLYQVATMTESATKVLSKSFPHMPSLSKENLPQSLAATFTNARELKRTLIYVAKITWRRSRQASSAVVPCGDQHVSRRMPGARTSYLAKTHLLHVREGPSAWFACCDRCNTPGHRVFAALPIPEAAPEMARLLRAKGVVAVVVA